MKALAPKDVAEILQCTPKHAITIMKYKDFPSFTINRSTKRVLRRVYEKDLYDWLEKQKDEGVVI